MLNPVKPTSSAEDLVDIESLAWDIMDRMIARWREAERRAKRARELADLDGRVERWAEFETYEELRRTGLLRAILATAPDFNRSMARPEKHEAPARGVINGHSVYMAVPDPYQEGEASGDNRPDKMQLLVVDRGAIVDASAGLPPAVYSPRAAD